MRTLPLRLAAPLAVLLATLLAGCASLPTQDWQALAPGLAQRSEAGGVQLLRLDLQAQALRLRLSDEADKGLPIDQRADALAAVAAFNASFFDRQFRARGLTRSSGQDWAEPLDAQGNSPLLACDAAQRCQLQLDAPYALPAGTHTAVAGLHALLRAGRARSAEDDARCGAFCTTRHPRTALGLSADRRWLYVLLAAGRRPDAAGLTLAEAADKLQQLGAHEALNLDGGGSSSLLLNGRSALPRPLNEPAQRRLANVLLIERRP